MSQEDLRGPLNGVLINGLLQQQQAQNAAAHGNVNDAQPQNNNNFNINSIARVSFPTMHSVNNIDLWFAQMRSWFELNRITADNTKYNMVVAHLRHDMIEQVEDLVRNPPANDKFEAIKNALVLQFADSERTRIHKLLSGITLGDKKPSHLLQELRRANVGGDDSLLKNVWMQRMPVQAQAALSIAQGNLTEVAALADAVVETLRINSTFSISEVSAVNQKSETDKKMDELIKIVAELRAERGGAYGRSESRGRSENRGNRDRSRARSSPREFDLCWYHFNFGANAKKCGKNANPPKTCKYDSKND